MVLLKKLGCRMSVQTVWIGISNGRVGKESHCIAGDCLQCRKLSAIQETWVRSLGQEVPLEKEMATHSSILAWKIPWAEELGGLQPIRSQREGHHWETNHHPLEKVLRPLLFFRHCKWFFYTPNRVSKWEPSYKAGVMLGLEDIMSKLHVFSSWHACGASQVVSGARKGGHNRWEGRVCGCLQSVPAQAAAAKSRQSCPTLCDPIDSSPPGSTVPGILQARTLEWGAISGCLSLTQGS